MVLPAFYELFVRGLLPPQFRLVGNGRGDVAHEDFRARVRESLDEFGSDARPVPVRASSPSTCSSPAAGSKADDPGSLLDVIGEAERELGGKPS